MKDEDLSTVPAQADKTKEQLINELVELRQRVAELAASERQPKSSKVVLAMFQGDIHQLGKNILK